MSPFLISVCASSNVIIPAPELTLYQFLRTIFFLNLLWRRKAERLVGTLDPEHHFMVLTKFHGFFGLGKWGISAQFQNDDNSAAAFGRYLGTLDSKALDRTIETLRPPKRQKILIREARIRVPNLVALLRISRDDGIHESLYRVLLRRKSQKIP